MIALIKQYFWTDAMRYAEITPKRWLDLLEHPLVREDKRNAPLAVYGDLVDTPMPSNDNPYRPRAVWDNIQSYHCLQVDYDSGYMTMDDFVQDNKNKYAFWTWTSHSNGFKEHERFRVVIPLETPVMSSEMGHAYRDVMGEIFPGSDLSCFDRAHFQVLPVIRPDGAPYYKYYVNRSKKRFSIPRDRVLEHADALRHRNDYINMFCEAADDLRTTLYGERRDDEEQRIANQLRWVQNQLETVYEGNRNNVIFACFGYMQRNGLLEYAHTIEVPAIAYEEWYKMMKRFCKY